MYGFYVFNMYCRTIMDITKRVVNGCYKSHFPVQILPKPHLSRLPSFTVFCLRNNQSQLVTHKDNTYCLVLQELPQAGLLTYLFCTMSSFHWEVTHEKMGLASAERQQWCEQLIPTRFSAVKDYFNDSLHPIYDQWVQGLNSSFRNFLNSTNNHVESINQILKRGNW